MPRPVGSKNKPKPDNFDIRERKIEAVLYLLRIAGDIDINAHVRVLACSKVLDSDPADFEKKAYKDNIRPMYKFG